MRADILLYDAEVVPVGKDQLQHLEMARDVGARFNNQMGEVFVLPQAELQENTKYVPGTDGNKNVQIKRKYYQYIPSRKGIEETSNVHRDRLYTAGRTEKS